MLNPSDHPLLKYDILVEVFSNIEISGQDGWPYYWGADAYSGVKGEGSTTLARAARVCKAFSNPALDELWAAPCGGLYTLLHLLSALRVTPKQEYAFSRRGARTKYEFRTYVRTLRVFISPRRFDVLFRPQELDDHVDLQEWERMLSYASRIRRFGFFTSSGPSAWLTYKITPASFEVLHRRAEGHTLFPNLQVLCCQLGSSRPSPDDPYDFLLRIAVSPTLANVTFRHPHHGVCWGDPVRIDQSGAPSDITTIVSRCPSIRRFVADLQYTTKDLYPLSQCRTLQSICINKGEVGIVILMQLSSLPGLELLQVSLLDAGEEEDRQTDISLDVDQDIFPSLRELIIGRCGAVIIGRALALLSTSPSCPLASLRLDASYGSDLEPVNVIQHLASPSISRSLRTLCLLFSFHSTSWRWARTARLELFPACAMLEPLLSLGALEDLEVHARERRFSLADADLVRCARAWPRLRRLVIPYDGNEHDADDAHPSLLAAADLAMACARLEVLALALADVTEADARALEARAAEGEGTARAAGCGGQDALVQLVPAWGCGTRRERMRVCGTERIKLWSRDP
ncbi:uncharacterized protein BXZ73DRAFT_82999 [Epithele typhae]|uniref:uncharacterized protein n=1 Tax=Epithele typhae TaxID=378194 RepID=UPI002007D406|nr:uncharacterized protein BXZ73DRAFT_82999 [Epithele typhae]KAH9911056.1 hypothetical protein BXZ73DRAFT_82999 [Epithele typhae]